jgi:hypothetical protein
VTVDEIIDSCADSCADDWAFWIYLCGDAAEDLGTCARAVCLRQPAIGLSWRRASADEVAALPPSGPANADGEHLYHWIELLHEGAVVYRHLAVWADGVHASLPVPSAEPRGNGDGSALWVSRRAYRLARLANEVDPDCGDFDLCFAVSGIELRSLRWDEVQHGTDHQDRSEGVRAWAKTRA